MRKILLLIISIQWSLSMLAQVGTNIDLEYTHTAERLCWDSAGVRTDLFGVYLFTAGQNEPVQTNFHNLLGQQINPTIGSVPGGTSSVTLGTCLELLQADQIQSPPDSCNCNYTLDLENHSYFIGDNTQFYTWNYEKVVQRYCGAGVEEILRMPVSYQVPTTTRHTYKNDTGLSGAQGLQNGLGFIDSILIHFDNPAGSTKVDLNPSTVLTSYPSLTGVLNPSDLIFNSGDLPAWETAVTLVLSQAVQDYSTFNLQPVPTFLPYVDININGVFEVGFIITNNPIGHYVNIDFSDPAAEILYFPDAVTPNNNNVEFQDIVTAFITGTYNAPCGEISTFYNGFIGSGASDWNTLELSSTSPTLIGQLGTVDCPQPCPSISTTGCTTICDTLRVEVVELPETNGCLVKGIADQMRLSGLPGNTALGSNALHSITIHVVSGTFNLTLTRQDANLGLITNTKFYDPGDTISFTHPNSCKYLVNGFNLFTGGGDADVKVAIMR